MGTDALELLEELERTLAATRPPTAPADDEPTPAEWRLWILEALGAQDVEVLLLVHHLLQLVAEPSPHRVAEWLGDFAQTIDPPRREGGERPGELSRLTAVLHRLMRQPVEVRTAAVDMLLVLTLSPEDRQLLHLTSDRRAAEGPSADPRRELPEDSRRLLDLYHELSPAVRGQVRSGLRGLCVGDLAQVSTAFTTAYSEVEEQRAERGQPLRRAETGWEGRGARVTAPHPDTPTGPDRRRLAAVLRRLHVDLGAVLVELDRNEGGGFAGIDPVHLGRLWLLSWRTLVGQGVVSVEQVVDAVRATIVERVPGATTNRKLRRLLDGLGTAEDLASLLRRLDQELSSSQRDGRDAY